MDIRDHKNRILHDFCLNWELTDIFDRNICKKWSGPVLTDIYVQNNKGWTCPATLQAHNWQKTVSMVNQTDGTVL
jgi:hypothetical protein